MLSEIGRTFDFEEAAKFSRMPRRRRNGLIMAYKHRIGTNKLKGANNKIKVLKRVAHGYLDFEYVVLKIKRAVCGAYAGTMRILEIAMSCLKAGSSIRLSASQWAGFFQNVLSAARSTNDEHGAYLRDNTVDRLRKYTIYKEIVGTSIFGETKNFLWFPYDCDVARMYRHRLSLTLTQSALAPLRRSCHY